MAVTVHGENRAELDIVSNGMRVDVGGGIITDGLIRHYDFANQLSYPGIGTTWTDLSPSGINALTTGPTPTFTTTRLGGLIFDGTATGPQLQIPYVDLGTDPFAVDAWFTFETNAEYLRGTLSCADLWSSFAPDDVGWAIGYSIDNTGVTAGVRLSTGGVVSGTATFTQGDIVNVFIHRNTSTQVVEIYMNGRRLTNNSVLNSISLTGNRNPITSAFWLASLAPAKYRPLTTFHSIKIYQNKNFTIREVLKNYNALAPRFGLV